MNLQEYKRGFHPIYILPLLYVIMAYTFPVIFFKGDFENRLLPLLMPIALGLVNLVITLVLRGKISRLYYLNFAVLIKYCLIPFYVAGAIVIAIALFFMLMPIAITVFIGPMVAVLFTVMGWLVLIGAAPYSLAYIIESRKENVHGRILSLAAGIMQFFFVTDIIAVIVLAFREGRWKKLAFTILPLVIASFVIIRYLMSEG